MKSPHRLVRTVAAVVLCVGATLASSGTAHAETWGRWVSAATGKCLTVFPSNDVVGQDFCEAGRQTQLWTTEFVDEGALVYQLRSASGGCLWARYILGAYYAYRTECNANHADKRFFVANGYISPDFSRGMKVTAARAYDTDVVVISVPRDYSDPRVKWTYNEVRRSSLPA
ncbi:hypothetical protein [Streptomyces sp. NPDC046727]|uniref:hypothetical protein n=1 Tax=Streptomyces sp. NPDC046727 TaxID=3155373 RepID=UPI0033DF11AC